jgi:acetolactate synthase regulatory subunit
MTHCPALFLFVLVLLTAPPTAAFDLTGATVQPSTGGSFRFVDLPSQASSVSLALVGTLIAAVHQLPIAPGGVVTFQAADELSAGTYVVTADPNASAVCRRLVTLHSGFSLISIAGRTHLSVAGRQQIRLRVDGLVPTDSAVVRLSDGLQVVEVHGTCDMATSEVRARAPAWQVPSDWFARNKTDLPAFVAISLDGGVSFSNNLTMNYSDVAPLKLGFIYSGAITDFGWNFAQNRGRMAVEDQYGALVDASFYVENVPEGECRTTATCASEKRMRVREPFVLASN